MYQPVFYFGCLFAVALLVSYLCTPILRRLALLTGIIDAPGPRKVHRKPMPYLGGLAFFLSLLSVLTVVMAVWPDILWDDQDGRRYAGLLIGATLLVLVGLYDDVRPTNAWVKLPAHILAGVAAYWGGFRVEMLGNPLTGTPIYLDGLGVLITVGWFVGLINAMNLIDGLDGLASGIACIAAFSLMSVILPGGTLFDPGLTVALVVGAALAGGTLGFLPHNFHPARIFMGDTGSMLLGFLLAAMSVAVSEKATAALPLAIPILGLAVPIFDTLSAIVRRSIKGHRVFSADNEHLHHRLLRIGVSHREVVLLIYFASASFGIMAYVVSGLERSRLFLLLFIVVAMVFIALQILKFIERRLAEVGLLAPLDGGGDPQGPMTGRHKESASTGRLFKMEDGKTDTLDESGAAADGQGTGDKQSWTSDQKASDMTIGGKNTPEPAT